MRFRVTASSVSEVLGTQTVVPGVLQSPTEYEINGLLSSTKTHDVVELVMVELTVAS